MELEPTYDELVEFSDAIGSKYLDSMMPLPGMTPGQQLTLSKECKHEGQAHYWQIQGQHSHGWCCADCGKVIQWG